MAIEQWFLYSLDQTALSPFSNSHLRNIHSKACLATLDKRGEEEQSLLEAFLSEQHPTPLLDDHFAQSKVLFVYLLQVIQTTQIIYN